MRSLAYDLSRHWLGGAPLIRYPGICLLLGGALWATGWLPGRWWVSSVLLLAFVALTLALRQLRRQDFVFFQEDRLPVVVPAALSPGDKIPIHATGLFSVEGKYQRYTWLPGLYRTFATGEHAILCLVRDRRFFWAARWPESEIGMWYIFFTPEAIARIRWGMLHFGNEPGRAIAVDYHLSLLTQNRQKSPPVLNETVYLTCQNDMEGQRILADLLYNLPSQTTPSSSSHVARQI